MGILKNALKNGVPEEAILRERIGATFTYEKYNFFPGR